MNERHDHWEASRNEQLRHWAALSLREILEALEEMEQLGERLRPPHVLAVPSVDPGAADA